MKLSIIITLFNRKELVRKAIDSCLTLNILPNEYEIIVIDDGSTDHPLEILSNYINSGGIKYFYQDNAGPASAKNFGAKKATGDYITFLDSDDYFTGASAFDDFLLHYNEQPDFLYTESIYIKVNDIISLHSTPYDGENLYKYIMQYPLNYPGKPAYIFRREKFYKATGFNESHKWGDALLFWRVFLKDCNSIAMSSPNYVYDQSLPSGISRGRDSHYYMRVLNAIYDSYLFKKDELQKLGYEQNWLIVIFLLSIKARQYGLTASIGLKLLLKPYSTCKSVFFIIQKRLRRG